MKGALNPVYLYVACIWLVGLVAGVCRIFQEPTFENLTPPIEVIAVKKQSIDAGPHGGYGSIVLKDAEGRLVTLDANVTNCSALVATYNKGDTIR